jgi:hypothetical protein
VPKQKWKLPEIKEGRIDIGRLDLLARQTRPGDPDEFYTVLDLTQRNVNMALLHIFYMCTEPYTYLRFCLMDDWGCYATWFTLLNTLFFPIKPLFTLIVVTIQLEFNGKIIPTDVNDLGMMLFNLSEGHGLKACLFGSYQQQMYVFAKLSLKGRNAKYLAE